MYRKVLKNKEKIASVAPMMDWTDRHCRAFHRTLTRSALLYSEMVTTGAVIHGDREGVLGFSACEQPVACQLGGSDPADLAKAAAIVQEAGYREVNLNVGCPSDRVQSGSFGACLMAEPSLVGDCVRSMKAEVDIPVTVKCRLGIDDQDTEIALDQLADAVIAGGADAIWVHARKAWLNGLSPKENRDVPPLDYDRVYRLKERMPKVFVGINGGIASIDACKDHLEKVDGVMLGRAAYHTPSILLDVDDAILGFEKSCVDVDAAVRAFFPYIEEQLEKGVKLSHITRHILGLFQGVPGARAWRRRLTVDSIKPGAGLDVVEAAFSEIVERRGTIPLGESAAA